MTTEEPEAIVCSRAFCHRATIKKLGYKIKTHNDGTFYRDGLPVNTPRNNTFGGLDPIRLYLPEHEDWQEGLDELRRNEEFRRNLKPVTWPRHSRLDNNDNES